MKLVKALNDPGDASMEPRSGDRGDYFKQGVVTWTTGALQWSRDPEIAVTSAQRVCCVVLDPRFNGAAIRRSR